MKLTNLELALALGDASIGHPRQTQRMLLADYLATHPTSSVFYELALHELGVHPDDVPSESWHVDTPSEATAALAVKIAIGYLNQEWHKGKLQRRIAIRRLAWHAQLLARRLDEDCKLDTENIVNWNKGTTAGIFKGFVPTPATRAELSALFYPPAPAATQEPLSTTGESA